jgi:hypothetical protein
MQQLYRSVDDDAAAPDDIAIAGANSLERFEQKRLVAAQ